MGRPAFSAAPWAIVLAGMSAGLGGCGSTYGTGQAPEMALFREMTGGLLDREEKEPIQYNPRAPLVMPPTASQLPAPVATAAAATGDWPLDSDQAVAGDSVSPEEDLRYGGGQAEYRRLRPLAAALPARPREAWDNDGEMNDQAYDIVHSRQQQEEFSRALAEANGLNRTERRFLTDPPLDYREPAATAPTEFEEISKKKDGNFITRWFLGG